MAQHEEAARFLKMINEAAANNARGERLLESMRKDKAMLRAKLDQASTEFESKKTDRRKSQEEYKTLSAQLMSVQATVSTKKARISILQEELNRLRTRLNAFEEEKDNYRTLFTSKMQTLNETLRRLHAENSDAALKEELQKKQEKLAVLEEKAKVQEQSSLEKSNEGELSNTRSEIMALELEVKETEVYTATQKETLSAKREHNTIVIKQMNEVNKQKFEKQKKLEQLQHLEREYAELENLQRDSGIAQEAFAAAHKDFQTRSACPKCGTNAYANAEKGAEKLDQEE